jgi:hypothetical protein
MPEEDVAWVNTIEARYGCRWNKARNYQDGSDYPSFAEVQASFSFCALWAAL